MPSNILAIEYFFNLKSETYTLKQLRLSVKHLLKSCFWWKRFAYCVSLAHTNTHTFLSVLNKMDLQTVPLCGCLNIILC